MFGKRAFLLQISDHNLATAEQISTRLRRIVHIAPAHISAKNCGGRVRSGEVTQSTMHFLAFYWSYIMFSEVLSLE